jgi:invasion protein IalB
MRMHHFASLLALALPLAAQTEAPQTPAKAEKTEKLWRINCSGIGG